MRIAQFLIGAMGVKRRGRRRTKDPVAAEYGRLAPIYDRRWRFYVKATVRETMRRMRLEAGARVLDVGCGTGVLLAALAKRHPEAELAGIDAVPEMLAMAKKRLPQRVELHEGMAEELPFEDGSFDAVISCSVLHYVRRPEMALSEMRRVLRPGGQVVITDWCRDYMTSRMLHHYLQLTNRSHHRTYSVRELRWMMERAGFQDVGIDCYRLDWFWGLMTGNGRMEGSGLLS